MNIRAQREAAGVGVRELARAMGVTPTAVVLWETGENIPTADKLPLLAKTLGCSIDELFRKEAS